MSVDPKKFGISDSLVQAVSEALKGGQKKLDKNHNGKLDSQDFKMLRKEEDEYIEEKLTKGDPASKWIHDFVHSDNPKFAGKSAKERQKQALAAYYAKQRNEEVEQVDEVSLKTKINAYKAASSPDADYNYGSKVHAQADRLRSKIAAKHGEKAGTHADRAAYGKPSTPATRSAEKAKSDPLTKASSSTNKMRITKSGVANKQDQKSNAAIIKSRLGKHGKSNLPEELEQVDDLSKATLGSYIKKAANDVASKSAAVGRYAERSNKEADHRKKTGDTSGYQQGRKDSKFADKMFDKSWKRRQGIKKATDKLTKEDVQIDEVLDSPMKKLAYVMKAKKSIEKSDPNKIKQANDIANRTLGVQRLMRKISKKKVSEHVEEATENPVAKELAAKKAEIQKTVAQKKIQVMQAKANKQIASMKEAKCTCTEGKKSMSCEVCNDKAMGIKGGKEKIQLNPPLRD